MSCLQQKQTLNYNLTTENSIQKTNCLLDNSLSNSIENESTNHFDYSKADDLEQSKDDLNENIKLKLRNSSKFQTKNDIHKSTTIKNSLFDQLIEHAKQSESTDFELSFISQFCDDNSYKLNNIANSFNSNDKLNHNQNHNLNGINLNKRNINYLELDNDRTEFKNLKLFNNQQNMNELSFNSKENHLQLKELNGNFKNLKSLIDQNDKSTKLQIKSISKIYLNDKIFKFNDGLVNIDNINFVRSNDLNNNSINQIHNYLFKLENKSTIFQLFTFQDDQMISDLENDHYQTSIIALIEFEQLIIWTKLINQTEWTVNKFKLDHNQQVFRCIKIEKEDFVCIFLLVYSQNLISLKYCLIDKKTKSIDFKHVETFELVNEISKKLDLNLIQLCFVNPCSIILSIPRNDHEKIDILCYDNVFLNYNNQKKELLNKDLKRIIYIINNYDNKLSSLNNCFLSSDELDNNFLAIFNQRLFMCNLIKNKVPIIISLKKYTNQTYSYFDILYDKGIFYLFAGNMFKNYVRVFALNIERCLVGKLIKYDIDKQLDELRNQSTNQIDNEESNDDDDEDDNRIVKLFKRIGDHLLIVKNNNTIILYNLFTDQIVYHTKLSNNVDDISIAVLQQKTTILAVLNNQFIVNIVDL